MTTWEYKIQRVATGASDEAMLRELNSAGAEGWEVVTVLAPDDTNAKHGDFSDPKARLLCLLKRPTAPVVAQGQVSVSSVADRTIG